MTGRAVDADEALRIGLVHRLLAGDPLAGTLAFAREFTRYSLPALAFAREAVQRALTTTLDEGLRIEADLSTLSSEGRSPAWRPPPETRERGVARAAPCGSACRDGMYRRV